MRQITINYCRGILMTALAVLLVGSMPTASAQDVKGEKPKPDAKQNLCKPHKAAKEDCFICDPKLREKGRLWCKEHDRYEDRCWICHPEAQDKKRLFCKEHSLYEDECFLCHPELKKKKPSAGATPSAPEDGKSK